MKIFTKCRIQSINYKDALKGNALSGFSTRTFILVLSLLLCFIQSFAQNRPSLTGKLFDKGSGEPIPFAGVALLRLPDSLIISGSITDETGTFIIEGIKAGKYALNISYICYESYTEQIELKDNMLTDVGTILLQETYLHLKEMEVKGERIRAKSETGKTTFFMTPRLSATAGSPLDLLKQVPGIRIDLQRNITLDNSSNILIYVNGIIRDKNYISQLDPASIEKIEVINVPSSNQDSNITGAINIMLKEEKQYGLSGLFYTEIPASPTEVFVFPSYRIDYGFKKINFFTSYNGSITYLNLQDSIYRSFTSEGTVNELTSNQEHRQKEWSHKFHYGFDYFVSAKDVINFYAFYNPYSRELDGTMKFTSSGSSAENLDVRREDTDNNRGAFYSMYYKHSFKKPGSEISIDISNHSLNANNSIEYVTSLRHINTTTISTTSVKPLHNSTTLKVDYSLPLSGNLKINAGLKAKFQHFTDRNDESFEYTDNLKAAYTMIALAKNNYDLTLGIRVEKSSTATNDTHSKSSLTALPYAGLKIKISPSQNLAFTYNSLVYRPGIYQLNPFVALEDPYSTSSGNTTLKPELRKNFSLEHTVQFNSNFISTKLFYKINNQVIDNVTRVSDSGIFETKIFNLGSMSYYGVQFSGSLKTGNLTISPSLKLYHQYTNGNEVAEMNYIANRHQNGFESSVSAFYSFKNDLSVSLTCQYSSTINNFQDDYSCDPLYFISVDKAFKKHFKAGITSGIPFMGSFLYSASDINSRDFTSRYEGRAQMSIIPLWFKFSYQFKTGDNRNKVDRLKEEIDALPKKGF